MNSESWVERVSGSSKESYTKGEVKQLLDSIQPEYHLYSVPKVKVGYVFSYRLVGGKSRPWVALWVRKGFVGCATLTHSNLPHGYKSECPFYSDSFIGPTITVLPEERLLDCQMAPYTSKKHLSEVKQKIRELWG